MEGEACLYSKFGLCKFKDECKNNTTNKYVKIVHPVNQ